MEQTADYLTQTTPLDGADYRRRAETGDLAGLDASKYDFLALRPAGASLEGFLYPDSYRLSAEAATRRSICWGGSWTSSPSRCCRSRARRRRRGRPI